MDTDKTNTCLGIDISITALDNIIGNNYDKSI